MHLKLNSIQLKAITDFWQIIYNRFHLHVIRFSLFEFDSIRIDSIRLYSMGCDDVLECIVCRLHTIKLSSNESIDLN